MNQNGDKYWFNKPTVSINNILFGNVYIEVHGDVEIVCDMFKVKANLMFNEKSWTKAECSVEGKIYKNEEQVCELTGFWNKHLTTKNTNGTEKLLWTKKHQLISDQYNFNSYSLQLNHLYQNLIK